MFRQLLDLIRTNSFARLALGATVGILILIAIFSSSKDSPSAPLPISTPTPRTEIANLSQEQRTAALTYKQSIESNLPIYQEGFVTSTGIVTTLNLYSYPDDPEETVRFEIYGLSYLNSDPSPFTNPNVTAFQESFNYGLSLLKERGIDPKKLIFIYGDKEYVRTTIESWIDRLELLN